MQKFALKVCTKHWSSDYESLLQLCKLPTLASRRHYLKLCVLYQVVNGHLHFPMAPVVPRNLPRSLRNTSTLALERPVTCTNAYQSSFSHIQSPCGTAYLHLHRTPRHCNRLYYVTLILILNALPNTCITHKT